jgi:putative restriction endonuclease
MRNYWNREDLILVFNLYCKIPYGQFNNRSKDVIELAKLIGRTPGAVAYILVNYVSLDPVHKAQGRKGAGHIGKLGEEVFYECRNNWVESLYESENILASRHNTDIETTYSDLLIDLTDKKGETKIREVKARINQHLFRKSVLTNFASRCAITGINVPELLIASHIKPWSKDEANRLNPSNGLCLSATYDKAFDEGLISINENLEIMISDKLKQFSNQAFYQNYFKQKENTKIALPQKFVPNLEFIRYHNEVVFDK